jgi:hypothetical protein
LSSPQLQKSVRAKCSTASFPNIQRVGSQVSAVTMSHPSPRNIAPPPCLPPYIKDSLKEDTVCWLVGCLQRVEATAGVACKRVDWLVGCKVGSATAGGCCLCVCESKD